MQVFGLPGHVIRNAARASRILSSPGAETARRAELVRRWRRAWRDGLTVEQAAHAVGVSLSKLRREGTAVSGLRAERNGEVS